jgi:hypothetical protein
MKDIPKKVIEYIEKSNFKEIIINMVKMFSETDKDIQVAIKWRAVTFTKNDNWHHWICNITSKNKVSLFFHKGSILKDPKKILQGDGKALRKIDLLNFETIDKDYIKKLFKDAINKQLKMPENVNMI